MLNQKTINKIEQAIGYVFVDKHLLSQAFTRSSYRNEHSNIQDNEILEFIGDAALSLIVTNILYDKYAKRDVNGLCTHQDEGDFSMMRSTLVNKNYLAKQMGKLHLQEYLLMGIGDVVQGIGNSKSVLEDLFESIIGAVYLDTDRNLKKTECVVCKILDINTFFLSNNSEKKISYKNDVQEWCQKYGYDLPTYDTNQNSDGFTSYCAIEKLGLCELGYGHNSKEAENNAAKIVMGKIKKEFEFTTNKLMVTYDNSINVLQELCTKKKYDFPIYETVRDIINSDNSHSFTVRCSLNGEQTYGNGSKVKDAKKQAAYNMLKVIGLV